MINLPSLATAGAGPKAVRSRALMFAKRQDSFLRVGAGVARYSFHAACCSAWNHSGQAGFGAKSEPEAVVCGIVSAAGIL